MLSKALLKDALNDAFRTHFVKLATVLMGDPTEEQRERTMRGFRNAVKAYERFEKETLEKWEQ